MNDNEFLLKTKDLPMDSINMAMEEQLRVLTPFCGKRVVIKLFSGSIWEGELTGYDMFQLHLNRNGETEKFLLSEIDKIKLVVQE